MFKLPRFGGTWPHVYQGLDLHLSRFSDMCLTSMQLPSHPNSGSKIQVSPPLMFHLHPCCISPPSGSLVLILTHPCHVLPPSPARSLVSHFTSLGPTDSKVYGRQKGGVKILCVAAELKSRGQKSICGHKKGGQYSMSHWKIGVKILCSKSWEGQNSMKAKYGGKNSIFFSWNPWSKFYVPWKGGQNSIFFPSALKKGGQNRGAYQPTSLKGSHVKPIQVSRCAFHLHQSPDIHR